MRWSFLFHSSISVSYLFCCCDPQLLQNVATGEITLLQFGQMAFVAPPHSPQKRSSLLQRYWQCGQGIFSDSLAEGAYLLESLYCSL